MNYTIFKAASSMLLERRVLVMFSMVCSVGLLCFVTSREIIKSSPCDLTEVPRDPLSYPRCSMDACFNFTRCEHSEELLVYLYNDPEPHDPPTYFRILPNSVWHTNHPEEACLLFYFSDSEANKVAWKKPAYGELPYWNGGLNHVIVTFADRWADTNPSPESTGMASLLSTKLQFTSYRRSFDIAIPLPRRNSYVVDGISELKPFDRKYFLTFKGKRYLSREGVFRSSQGFRGMHNGKDVVVVTTCDGKTNKKVLEAHPECGAGCVAEQAVYDSYDYNELMNSTFALAPAGRSPASYRMFEVIANGAIPVLIADDYVKPFDTLIQWQYCILQFPTSEIHRILPTLRAVPRAEVEYRQRYCKRVFELFLKDDDTLISSVMRSLKERFMGMLSNFPLNKEFMKGHK